MTFSCRKATELISAAQDRPLSRRERMQLRLHLFICGWCRTYQRQLRTVRALLQMPSILSPEAPAAGQAPPASAMESADPDQLTLDAQTRERIRRAIINSP